MYTRCLIFCSLFFGRLYIPSNIYCQMYPFLSSIKEEVLCFVVGHVLRKGEGCCAFLHIEGKRRLLHYDNKHGRHGRHESNTKR